MLFEMKKRSGQLTGHRFQTIPLINIRSLRCSFQTILQGMHKVLNTGLNYVKVQTVLLGRMKLWTQMVMVS